MSTRCRTAFALPAATAALALAVAGCSSLKVKTDYDPNVDFARYNTYAWLKPPVKDGASESPVEELVDPFARNSLLDKRVRSAVEKELAARGYQKASDGSGHFRVAYHVILKDKTRVRTNPGVYYGGYYDRGHYGASYGGASSYDYQEGTLLIDVIDARSDSIAWRGWAIGTNKEGYYSEKQVAKAAHKILEKFPPQGVTPTSSDEEALRRRVDELEQRLKELDEQEQKGSGA
jgi:hypothetical protein